MSAGRLAGLSIVIVGATSGIGLSAARACRREGAHLTLVGRDDAHLAATVDEFGAAAVLAGDATRPDLAPRAIEHASARHGTVHGVFHVAGGSGRRAGDGPLDRLTDGGWRHTLDLNLTTLFHTNRAAVRHFLNAGHGGAVVNVSSVLAFAPSPHHFATHAYAAAKAAVIGLTTSCASYYAPHDIRFNVVAPALVDTPGAARATADADISAYTRARQPLDGGRVGQPTDLDGAIVFLLSPESRYVTGQVIAVDGGWSVSDAARGQAPA